MQPETPGDARFRTLIERSFDAIELLAADGAVLYASPSVVRIGGRNPEEIVSRDAFEWSHPDDLTALRERFEQSLRTLGGTVTAQYRHRHKDGSWRWVEASIANFLGDPEVGAIICNVHDVTEHRQAEEALRESERRYRILFERNLAGILLTTADGKVLDCNDALVRMLGYGSREEVLARPARDLHFDPADRDSFLARLREHRFLSNHELRFRHVGGTPAWVLVNASLWAGEGGEELVFATLVDVTERRRLEEQLRQAQKMEAIGQLAGGVAHDFNNLLTVINGYGDILLSALPADDPARELVGEMKKAGERAAGLTRQLLAFSRKAVLALRDVDLNVVVIELEKMLRRVIGEDVNLATRLSPTLGQVHADPSQLEQVLLNLAVNARDAMPQGGKLTIETQNVTLDEGYARAHPGVRSGRYVLLAVSDTGTGMTEEVKRHAFEPFFTTKGADKGTGLGLATVYGIVIQSGGHVEVHSEPGHGATFKIYLPRVEQPGRARKSGPSLGAAPRGDETVLLVEDDDGVRALSRHALQASGYAVLEAADGTEAYQVAGAHQGPIHLLVTDVVLPGLGGGQLAERLVVLRPGLRVLYLSGYTSASLVRHGILVEQVAFLQKPFSPAALAWKVREVLDGGDIARPAGE